MQFELNAFDNIIRNRITVAALRTSIGQLRQIISFELDAIDLIVSTQFLDFLLPLFRRKLVLTILITRKLIIELLLREFSTPLIFRTERSLDRKSVV